MIKVLIVDDDSRIRKSLKGLLEDEGYSTLSCDNGEKGVKIVSNEKIDVVLLDVVLPGLNGIETLKELKDNDGQIKVIMISGQADFETAVQATKLGAYNFFEKPLNPDKILLDLKNITRQISMERKISDFEDHTVIEDEIVGKSAKIKELIRKISKTAPSDGRVLIYGENGTGKELVAKALHQQSKRNEGPFVSLNCAAFPKELIESELFGYQKGAFTGAVKNKPGKFEIADNGTLFLDEIGDMSLDIQAKLLRVLEENEAVRLGSNRTYTFNVRVISATNKNLEDLIRKGDFREDLYYRLNVIPITVPPLRERNDDISLLADYFLKQICASTGRGVLKWGKGALDLLQLYHWSGNVRELKNFVERLVILSEGSIITEEQVRENFPIRTEGVSKPDFSLDFKEKSLKDLLQEYEKNVLLKGFKQTRGNVSELSRLLKVDRANLHRKLKKYKIK